MAEEDLLAVVAIGDHAELVGVVRVVAVASVGVGSGSRSGGVLVAGGVVGTRVPCAIAGLCGGGGVPTSSTISSPALAA